MADSVSIPSHLALPLEIIDIVFQFADKGTLISASQACHLFMSLSRPFLFRELLLDAFNLHVFLKVFDCTFWNGELPGLRMLVLKVEAIHLAQIFIDLIPTTTTTSPALQKLDSLRIESLPSVVPQFLSVFLGLHVRRLYLHVQSTGYIQWSTLSTRLASFRYEHLTLLSNVQPLPFSLTSLHEHDDTDSDPFHVCFLPFSGARQINQFSDWYSSLRGSDKRSISKLCIELPCEADTSYAQAVRRLLESTPARTLLLTFPSWRISSLFQVDFQSLSELRILHIAEIKPPSFYKFRCEIGDFHRLFEVLPSLASLPIEEIYLHSLHESFDSFAGVNWEQLADIMSPSTSFPNLKKLCFCPFDRTEHGEDKTTWQHHEGVLAQVFRNLRGRCTLQLRVE